MRNSLRRDACNTSDDDDGFPTRDVRPASIQLRPRCSQAAPPPPSAGSGRDSLPSPPRSLSAPDLSAGLDSLPAPPRRSTVGDSLAAAPLDGSLTSPPAAARGSLGLPPARRSYTPSPPRRSTVGDSLRVPQDGSLTSSPAAARGSLGLPPAARGCTTDPPLARVSPSRGLPSHPYAVRDSTYLPRVLRLEPALPIPQPALPIRRPLGRDGLPFIGPLFAPRAHPLVADAEGRLVTHFTFVPRVLRLECVGLGKTKRRMKKEKSDLGNNRFQSLMLHNSSLHELSTVICHRTSYGAQHKLVDVIYTLVGDIDFILCQPYGFFIFETAIVTPYRVQICYGNCPYLTPCPIVMSRFSEV